MCFHSLLLAKVEAQNTLNNVNDSTSRKGFTLFMNQPYGLLTKVRFNLAYKTQRDHTFMLSVSNYYQYGIQTFLEYQFCYLNKTNTENYFYARSGFGETGKSYSKYYNFFGAGLGKEIFIDKTKRFKMQGSLGWVMFNDRSNKLDFYFEGPGFPIDLNINFGYKF